MNNERLGEPMAGVVENAAEITSEPAFVELEISLPVSQYVRAEGSATEASEALAPHLSFYPGGQEGCGMKQARRTLMEIQPSLRVVGFATAVEDLGTHVVCGVETLYSRQMVYNVLKGKSGSRKLMERIVERRPDLLDLSFVAESTKALAKTFGWKSGIKARRVG